MDENKKQFGIYRVVAVINLLISNAVGPWPMIILRFHMRMSSDTWPPCMRYCIFILVSLCSRDTIRWPSKVPKLHQEAVWVGGRLVLGQENPLGDVEFHHRGFLDILCNLRVKQL